MAQEVPQQKEKKSSKFWKKDKKESQSALDLRAEADFEEKDVGLFTLFGPFIKNYASSMSKTKNPAKVPYPTVFYQPASTLMHTVALQTNYVDLLVEAGSQPTPETRFLGYLKYCFSTYALTKFPYKPIIAVLGETAQYATPFSKAVETNDKTFVLAENIRKDPPNSLIHINNPKHGISYTGAMETEPKFEKAHVHVMFKGQSTAVFTDPHGTYREEYSSDFPGVMIKLLRMHTELTGEVKVLSSTGFAASIAFKEKSMLSKNKNVLSGKVTFNGAEVYSIDGAWDDSISITNTQTGMKTEFINRSAITKNVMESLPKEQQLPSSSDRIWGDMVAALQARDFDTAAKLKVGINQNENNILSPEEIQTPSSYTSKYFRKNASGMWEIKDTSLCTDMSSLSVFNTTAMENALPSIQ